jgi:uncharacterized NAD(P)/FAD-binding protein YdhS
MPITLVLLFRPNGQVLGLDHVTRRLFAVGLLCQGSLWEVTAVPEIVRQANAAAATIAALRKPAEMLFD